MLFFFRVYVPLFLSVHFLTKDTPPKRQTFEQDLAKLGGVPLHASLSPSLSTRLASTTTTPTTTTTAASAAASLVVGASSGASSSAHSRDERSSVSGRSDAGSEASGSVSVAAGGGGVAGEESGAFSGEGGGGGGGGGQEDILRRRGWSRGGVEQQQGRGQGRRATLLDCVPVEREQKLLESCRTSQRRFRQEAEALAKQYVAIKKVSFAWLGRRKTRW